MCTSEDVMIDQIDHCHKVSGKTVTVRMATFLGQVIPAIHDSVKNEEDRINALIRIHKADVNILTVAMEKGTPHNTIISYVESLNVACWDIINKDLGTWEK